MNPFVASLVPAPAPHAERAPSAWEALVLGVAVVTSVSYRAGARTYVVEARTSGAPGLSRRERIVAERLGQGQSRKEIGHTLGVSLTTVGRAIERAAEKIGVENAIDVVVLAAAFGPGRQAGRSYPLGGPAGGEALTAPLHESAMWVRFSQAEREVVELALAGMSSTSIAQRRGDRSERTIANQLAQVFRKASVSGRAELAARLLLDERRRVA